MNRKAVPCHQLRPYFLFLKRIVQLYLLGREVCFQWDQSTQGSVFSLLLSSSFPCTAQRLLPPPRANVAPLYSCGNGQTGHCYAVQNWSGGTPGSRSSIFTNGLYSSDCFVTNEMWLATLSRQYWVEAGMISDIADQYGMESLFWADNRPGGGFSLHYGQFLDPSDFGKYTNIDIHKIASNQFSVRISGLPVASLSGTSTSNSINPALISIGLEMCGSAGTQAPRNGYTNNQYQRSNGSWAYQTALGYKDPQAYPAFGTWTVYPNPSNGGTWTTCIQGNGC